MHAPVNPVKKRGMLRRLAPLIATVILLGGCAATALTTVIVTSVDIARDRRTVGTYMDDNSVEVKIRRAIAKDPIFDRQTNISVTAMNGIVLLTGETPKPDQAGRAVTISRGYIETRQVINQISITEKTKLRSRSKDSWITAKVKSNLITTRGIRAGHVKVVTENRNVFLMGMVTQAEADLAVDVARNVRGVKRVTKVFEYL